MEGSFGRLMLRYFMHILAAGTMVGLISAQNETPTAYPQTVICCGSLQDVSLSCYNACLSLGTSCESSLENAEQYLSPSCGQIPEITLTCLQNTTIAMLDCCQKSESIQCITACVQALSSGSNDPTALINDCGPPFGFNPPPDPIYGCIAPYISDSPDQGPKEVTSDPLCPTTPPTTQPTQGADLARLQCCIQATDPGCQEACMEVLSLLFKEHNYETFYFDCLHRPSEAALVACIDDVSNSCQYGCSGLHFCSSLNLKSHSLYRRCNAVGDADAKQLYYQWVDTKFVNNPLVPFGIKDPTECMPAVWKEVACATAIKPCHPDTHTALMCREDCMQLMKNCSNDTYYSPGAICDILSPHDLQENCIPLASLIEERKGVSPMEIAAAASPCNSSPCQEGVCSVNRDCLAGDSLCVPYTCLPSCQLGGGQVQLVHTTALSLQEVERAHVLVSAGPDQHCYGYVNQTEADACGYKKEVDQQYCEDLHSCSLKEQSYAHNEVFSPDDCNFCHCYYGRLRCSNHLCPSDAQSGIPCGCLAFLFEPVCTPDGRTFPNPCYAKCAGYASSELDPGQCGGDDPCLSSPCPSGSRCVQHRHVCLHGEEPLQCPQYFCEPVGPDCSYTESVCDKNSNEHSSLCDFLLTAEELDYWGHCKEECSVSLRNPVCGVNGETFASKCHAHGNLIAVDYNEPCNSIPRENGKCPRKQCSQVFFSTEDVCIGPTPPGACCPKCGGMVRVLMDDALLARSQEVMATGPFISTTVIEKLRHLVDTRYCDLFGSVALDGTLSLLVLPENASSWFNVDTCNIQARSLAALVNTQSPILRSDPFLSHLVAANVTVSYKVPYQQTVTADGVKDPDEPSGCDRVGMATTTLLLTLTVSYLVSGNVR